MYRPAVVMENLGEMSRGSARSIKGFDITGGLTEIADLLESFCGQAKAAGFVAKTVNITEIENRLGGMVEELPHDELLPKLTIDAAVDLNEMTADLAENIKSMEPFGMANPAPVFAVLGGEIVDAKPVGKERKHLKLRLRDGKSARRQDGGFAKLNSELGTWNSLIMDAIAFNFGDRIDEILAGPVDVAFGLEENVWNGRTSLQLNVKDIRVTKG
jgi:single-stranded-DNA-specific exonuclease